MYEQIASNKRKTFFIMFFFIIFIIFLGWIFGEMSDMGYAGTPIALVIALIMTWGSYYNSDKLVLSISGAKLATHEDFTFLDNVVEGLAIAAGIPKPKLYVIETPAINAFATGRDPEHAAIAVTRGLLDTLNRIETEGVIAHEMSHIKNYDIRLQTIVVTLVGVVVLMSDWMRRSSIRRSFGGDDDNRGGNQIVMIIGLVLMILAPLFAELIKLALSRKREYLADADGAMITRYPEGLASALEKIASDTAIVKTANNATAPLFIANPFSDKRKFSNLFSTHPPLEDRIARLRAM